MKITIYADVKQELIEYCLPFFTDGLLKDSVIPVFTDSRLPRQDTDDYHLVFPKPLIALFSVRFPGRRPLPKIEPLENKTLSCFDFDIHFIPSREIEDLS